MIEKRSGICEYSLFAKARTLSLFLDSASVVRLFSELSKASTSLQISAFL